MNHLEVGHERPAAADVEIVVPRGEIDISNVELLDEALAEAASHKPGRLLVNLDGIQYMDSAGVSSLLRAGQRVHQHGGELKLVGGTQFIRRLLHMTRVDRLFAHHDSLVEALGGTAPDAQGHSPQPAEAEDAVPELACRKFS